MRRALALLVLASCGGSSTDPGLEAWLRISGAEYEPGPPPRPGIGPAVMALDVSRGFVAQGDTTLHLGGTLAQDANAVALWLEGDRGFWLLPAGLPDVTVPGLPTFAVTAGLARDAPLGPRALQALALSRDGSAGPKSAATIEIAPRSHPTGELVVSLSWDTNADLDLHVVDANGVEIWARNPNSWQAVPGAPPDPRAWEHGGILDVDSNAQCVVDGRDQENVVWVSSPPGGHYVVRVDTFSLCDQSAARWTAEARLRGQPVAQARGVVTPASTRPPHDLGAGVLALEFDVP